MNNKDFEYKNIKRIIIDELYNISLFEKENLVLYQEDIPLLLPFEFTISRGNDIVLGITTYDSEFDIEPTVYRNDSVSFAVDVAPLLESWATCNYDKLNSDIMHIISHIDRALSEILKRNTKRDQLLPLVRFPYAANPNIPENKKVMEMLVELNMLSKVDNIYIYSAYSAYYPTLYGEAQGLLKGYRVINGEVSDEIYMIEQGVTAFLECLDYVKKCNQRAINEEVNSEELMSFENRFKNAREGISIRIASDRRYIDDLNHTKLRDLHSNMSITVKNLQKLDDTESLESLGLDKEQFLEMTYGDLATYLVENEAKLDPDAVRHVTKYIVAAFLQEAERRGIEID